MGSKRQSGIREVEIPDTNKTRTRLGKDENEATGLTSPEPRCRLFTARDVDKCVQSLGVDVCGSQSSRSSSCYYRHPQYLKLLVIRFLMKRRRFTIIAKVVCSTVTFGRLAGRDYWPSCGMVTV